LGRKGLSRQKYFRLLGYQRWSSAKPLLDAIAILTPDQQARLTSFGAA